MAARLPEALDSAQVLPAPPCREEEAEPADLVFSELTRSERAFFTNDADEEDDEAKLLLLLLLLPRPLSVVKLETSFEADEMIPFCEGDDEEESSFLKDDDDFDDESIVAVCC